METLFLAILMALNFLFPVSADPNSPEDIARMEKAKYILENNLYKVNDGGVIIDPDVSL